MDNYNIFIFYDNIHDLFMKKYKFLISDKIKDYNFIIFFNQAIYNILNTKINIQLLILEMFKKIMLKRK